MKKRVIAVITALCAAFALLSAGALAVDAPEEFTIEDGVLTKYNGPGGDVVVPDGVTSIGGRLLPDVTV